MADNKLPKDREMTMDDDTTVRWKVDKEAEMYRFYLDLAVKTAVFLMAVTGAIVSYVLSQTGVLSHAGGFVASVALIFPVLLNVGFAVLCFFSTKEAKNLSAQHKKSCEALRTAPFNMNPLWAMCWIFFLMCSFAAAGLVFLMFWLPFR